MGHTPIARTFNFEAQAKYLERKDPHRMGAERLAAYLAEKRAAWEAMTPDERALRLLLGKLYRGESVLFDDIDRPLHVTPFGGAYGLAGYVIAVQGSPPKGTLMVHVNHCAIDQGGGGLDSALIVFLGREKAKVLGTNRASMYRTLTPAVQRDEEIRAIVCAFLTQRLAEHPEDLEIERDKRRQPTPVGL